MFYGPGRFHPHLSTLEVAVGPLNQSIISSMVALESLSLRNDFSLKQRFTKASLWFNPVPSQEITSKISCHLRLDPEGQSQRGEIRHPLKYNLHFYPQANISQAIHN